MSNDWISAVDLAEIHSQNIVPVEVINNHLVDYSLKVFAVDTKEAGGVLTSIFENRAYT